MTEIFDIVFKIMIGSLLGGVFWSMRTNATTLKTVMIDIAVIKKTIENVQVDHDKLVRLEMKTEKQDYDITNAHEKIRSMQHG